MIATGDMNVIIGKSNQEIFQPLKRFYVNLA